MQANSDIQVSDIVIHQGIRWEASGKATFQKCDLSWNISDTISIQTLDGQVSEKDLENYLPTKHAIGGIMDHLNLEISNWRDQPIEEWNISGDIEGHDLSFGDYQIGDARVSFEQSKKKFSIQPSVEVEDLLLKLHLNGSWGEKTYGGNLDADVSGTITGGTHWFQDQVAEHLPKNWRSVQLDQTHINLRGRLDIQNGNSNLLINIDLTGVQVDQFDYPKLSLMIQSPQPQNYNTTLLMGSDKAPVLQPNLHGNRTRIPTKVA